MVIRACRPLPLKHRDHRQLSLKRPGRPAGRIETQLHLRDAPAAYDGGKRFMAGLLEGKVALVTGGGNGIGREAALVMAREGARVAVADYEASAAQETVGQINAAGGQALSLAGDVTRAEAVKAMVDAAVAAYGRLDCAFNNAGIAGFQVDAAGLLTHEWSEKSFDRMIEVNLKGVWLSMKLEIPAMLANGGGAI